MIRKPSLQSTIDDFFSGDPAIRQLASNAGEELRKEHERMLARARETGEWSEILVGGLEPSKFTFRPLPGNVHRELADRINAGDIGMQTASSLFFRAALVRVTNVDGVTFKAAVDEHYPELGAIAHVDIANALDAIDPSIVAELSLGVFQRAQGPGPKS